MTLLEPLCSNKRTLFPYFEGYPSTLSKSVPRKGTISRNSISSSREEPSGSDMRRSWLTALLILFLLASTSAMAQEDSPPVPSDAEAAYPSIPGDAELVMDHENPLVGEQIDYRLKVELPPGFELQVPEAFAFPTALRLKKEEVTVKGPAIALPLYQGIMVQAFMPSAKGWLSGTGLLARWCKHEPNTMRWNSQFLMNAETAIHATGPMSTIKIGYREVARSTDTRSLIGSALPAFPCGHKVPTLRVPDARILDSLNVTGQLNSFTFDWLVRERLGSTALAWYVLCESCLPRIQWISLFAKCIAQLNLFAPVFSAVRLQLKPVLEELDSSSVLFALTESERIRCTAIANALSARAFGLGPEDLQLVLSSTDLPTEWLSRGAKRTGELDARGFWRVDKDKPPELRHTVLTLVAFHDLQEKIAACGGDVEAGIEAFCGQNDGEGWMLPETLRLADYGLGHDDRAKEHQPVRECFGPRFYDWQLAQSPEESWRECRLHARNLLGKEGGMGIRDRAGVLVQPGREQAHDAENADCHDHHRQGDLDKAEG